MAANRTGPCEDVCALVDTGSVFTWIPGSVLQRVGVRPEYVLEFETADGRVITRGVAEAAIRVNGGVRTALVIFGDEGTESLLGVHTLEACLLAGDPVNERLVRVRGLLKAMSLTSARLYPFLGSWARIRRRQASDFLHVVARNPSI